jgi:hypothetical protein
MDEGNETPEMKKGAPEYRKVSPKLWLDPEWNRLGDDAQKLWFCCLTGPHTTMLPGLSVVPLYTLGGLCRLSPRKAEKALGELVTLSWVEYDKVWSVLRLPNALRYNSPDNPYQLKAWMRQWWKIPACTLRDSHLESLRESVELAPTMLATIEEELRLGPPQERAKPRKIKPSEKKKTETVSQTVTETVLQTVSQTDSSPRNMEHEAVSVNREAGSVKRESPIEKAPVSIQTLSPSPVGGGAVDAQDDFDLPTNPQQAAPVRQTPAVDSTGQASLLPATGKPDRRRKPAGEPEDEPTATADLDRYVARWNELKKPPFPLSLTKEDRIFFFQQRKARGIDELVWVLEVLHGDDWSAGKTIRQLVSAEAAQKAAGLNAKTTKEPAFRSNRHAQSHENLDDVWQQP